jgi:hypothetical protein
LAALTGVGAPSEFDRLVAPQLFEVVVLANGGLHDVGVPAEPQSTMIHSPFSSSMRGLRPHRACNLSNARGQRLGLAIGGAGRSDLPLEQDVMCSCRHLDVLLFTSSNPSMMALELWTSFFVPWSWF